MKINEVERLVGITKGNIRFYEKEGLLPGAKQRERLPGLQRGGRDMAEEDQAAADAGCAH